MQTTGRIPQTVIEKVIQKYAIGLPAGKVVKAGDYVIIRPGHVATCSNTGPVISKYVPVAVPCACQEHWDTNLLTSGRTRRDGKPDSPDSVLRKYTASDSPQGYWSQPVLEGLNLPQQDPWFVIRSQRCNFRLFQPRQRRSGDQS